MVNSKISGVGHYIPEKVVTNQDLEKIMDTSDEWIIERTGIRERHYGDKHKETTSTMGSKAALKAIENAGINKDDIDFIIFATLSPDYYFPGGGVLLQRELGITHTEIGALDIRNQCSGFVYGLSIADQFIKTGMYKNILLVGAEMHSMGLDFTTRGRNVTVIFGDGAGAVIIQPEKDSNKGILNTQLHSNGTWAEKLTMINPGAHGGYHAEKADEQHDYGYPDVEYGEMFITEKMLKDGYIFPYMDGPFVFKTAVMKFPEVIIESLNKAGFSPSDLNMVIPHQANLRISQFVQKKLGLRDDQIWHNIQKYGNTTAASIPIALSEAVNARAIKNGDLVSLAAFGSGFTWASALIRW